MDPFVDLIRLLRPRATLWRRVDGSGRWGLSFAKRDDLLFCSVVKGECLLLRADLAPLRLGVGDFVLVRTSVAFRLASDGEVEAVESEQAFGSPETLGVRLGSGEAREVTLLGGRFVFDSANEEMLTGLLPPLVLVAAGGEPARRVRPLLALNALECAEPRPGADYVVARLMELILVEILRSELAGAGGMAGLVAGLGDGLVGPALRGMHGDVARGWTVAELARMAGGSRSLFAGRFKAVMGVGPIEYLANWRMAVAKDALRRGGRSIEEIAFEVGFQSASAFSTAFARRVGCSPRAFANRRADVGGSARGEEMG